MDQVLVPLKEVTAAATYPQVKYWAKLAGVRLVVSNHTAYVRPDEAETLRRIAAKVTGGRSPKEAVREVIGPPDHPIISPEKAIPPAPILPEITGRLESMEKAIMLLVDENRSLRGEVSALRLRLEAPPVVVEPVRPEPPRADPREIVEKTAMAKPVQRDTASIWEGLSMALNDVMGFAFGRG